MQATEPAKDYWILAPPLSGVTASRNALFALLYLPEHFKLALPGSREDNQPFLAEADGLQLAGRVGFVQSGSQPDVAVTSIPDKSAPNTVAGDSPPALASAILEFARNQ